MKHIDKYCIYENNSKITKKKTNINVKPITMNSNTI